jgi:hypothetical protein
MRRTRVAIEMRDRGGGVAGEVAVIMADQLGWNARETAAEVTADRALIGPQVAPERECDASGDARHRATPPHLALS